MKKILFLFLYFVSLSVFAQTDKTIGDLADYFTKSSDKNFIMLLGAISYIAGIYCAINGIIKLKDVNESKGQVKLKIPLTYLICAALFFGLPQLLETGPASLGLTKAESSNIR